MADKEALLVEAYRRNILPPEKKQAFEEAVRRGVITNRTAASLVEARKDGPVGSVLRSVANAGMLSLGDEFTAAMKAGEQRSRNLNNRILGRPITQTSKEVYQDTLAAERGEQQRFAQEHPAGNFASSLAGGLLTPGSGPAASFIGGAKNFGQALLRSAGVGAAFGGASGSGAGEGLRGRAEGAARGAATGAAVGAAIPIAARTAQGLGNATRGARESLRRTINPAGRDPEQEALRRLSEELRKDGVSPSQIQEAVDGFAQDGASSPALLDVAGENTRALIRAAAAKPGPGRQIAQQYEGRVVEDLQPTMIERTNQLTPDRRSAAQLTTDLTEQRSTQARTDYAQPYAQPIGLDDATQQALSGDAGRAALQRARRGAEANMDQAQLADIDRLLAGDFENPIAAGTLDRVKIAMRERASNATQQGARDVGRGLFQREGMIDQSLDAVPELGPAREAFRSASDQIRAVETGSDILGKIAASPDYAQEVSAMAPEALEAARVGARSAITDALGSPAAGSTGLLNRIRSSTNMRRNLEALFGEDEAGRYIAAAEREYGRTSNARFIAPNTGPKSANVLLDQENILSDGPRMAGAGMSLLRGNGLPALGVALDKLRRGATLTAAEAEAIVRYGTNGAAEGGAQLGSYAERLGGSQAPRVPSYGARAVAPVTTSLSQANSSR